MTPVKVKVPDVLKVRSLVESAELEVSFLLTVEPSRSSSSTVVQGVYEVFRKLGEALLLFRGKEATGRDSHSMMIQELYSLPVSSSRSVHVLENLKSLRHGVNYDGYIPTIVEVTEALDIARELFDPVVVAVKREVGLL